MRAKIALLSAVLLSVAGALSSSATDSCPCSEAAGAAVVQYAGFCWLHDGGDAARSLAEAMARRRREQCDYRLAAVPCAHVRIELAARMAKLLGLVSGGELRLRLRLALARDAAGDWQWLGGAGANNASAGNESSTLLMLPAGNGTSGNDTGALDVRTGQLVAVGADDLLPGLWQRRSTEMRTACHERAASPPPDDVISAQSLQHHIPHVQTQLCSRLCYKSPFCSFATVDRSGAVAQCIIHTGVGKCGGRESSTNNTVCNPESVERAMRRSITAGKSCAAIPFTPAWPTLQLQYSTGPDTVTGDYLYGTVARLRCTGGTLFHNRQSRLEVSCGEDGEWIGRNASMHQCNARAWLIALDAAGPSGAMVWLDIGIANGVMTIVHHNNTLQADSDDFVVAQYNNAVYLLNTLSGSVTKVGESDGDGGYGAVANLTAIDTAQAFALPRHNCDGTNIGSAAVVCGGDPVGGRGLRTCYKYNLDTGDTSEVASLPHTVDRNGMCTYNNRFYTLGGDRYRSRPLYEVWSLDALLRERGERSRGCPHIGFGSGELAHSTVYTCLPAAASWPSTTIQWTAASGSTAPSGQRWPDACRPTGAWAACSPSTAHCTTWAATPGVAATVLARRTRPYSAWARLGRGSLKTTTCLFLWRDLPLSSFSLVSQGDV